MTNEVHSIFHILMIYLCSRLQHSHNYYILNIATFSPQDCHIIGPKCQCPGVGPWRWPPWSRLPYSQSTPSLSQVCKKSASRARVVKTCTKAEGLGVQEGHMQTLSHAMYMLFMLYLLHMKHCQVEVQKEYFWT